MRQTRKNSTGFTLVEVVVAITLMSLIMVTLVMGLRLAANAWHRGEQKLDEQSLALSSTDLVAQQISSAAVRVVTEYRGIDRTPYPVVSFLGSAQLMRFSTRISWRGDHSRPQFMVEYRVVKSREDKQQLVINETGLTDDASVLAALHAPVSEAGQPIGAEADQIVLAYLRPATPPDPAQWINAWEPVQDAEFPQAVKVTWTRGNQAEQAVFPVAINHLIKVPR